jgi:6-phosphofructokinase 1
VQAAAGLGWEIVGIRDGYDGLLDPERYEGGGIVTLSPGSVESIDGRSILGIAPRIDPFHVLEFDVHGDVREIDDSDRLLAAIARENIEAVISLAGQTGPLSMHALDTAYRLSLKGLRTICIPKSIENDIAQTMLSFGYDSALNFTAEVLSRLRAAARDIGRIAVAEVPGLRAGWLAIQAAIAAQGDAALIPEIPYDLHKVAAKLLARKAWGHTPSLVIVAEGARPVGGTVAPEARREAGDNAKAVAAALARLTVLETYPIALGELVRGGAATAVDIQLGLASGAGAVLALEKSERDVAVVFLPPELRLVPLAEVVGRYRTVPPDSEFVRVAETLGIALGN